MSNLPSHKKERPYLFTTEIVNEKIQQLLNLMLF